MVWCVGLYGGSGIRDGCKLTAARTQKPTRVGMIVGVGKVRDCHDNKIQVCYRPVVVALFRI
jgi:hypothetical protein